MAGTDGEIGSMTKKALIIQPGLQHSHQLAWALYEQGLLDKFLSGVPVRTAEQVKPPLVPSSVWQRVKCVEVPADHRVALPAWWLAMKLATSYGKQVSRFRNMHRVLHAFDRTMALRIRQLKPQAVVAYENAALHTFKAARAEGALCILDAASFHYRTGNRLLESVDPEYQKKINAWKSEEISLADHVICCSELARQTYIDAGLEPDRVTALALGAYPPPNGTQPAVLLQAKPLRFIYAGAMRAVKSIDLVLAAFQRLHEQRPGQIELHIYGGSDGTEWIDKVKRIPNITYHGHVSQETLFSAMSQSHCLLMPSRIDSFGMVVAEAMAVGTPAIVSEQTGAKMIIERHPDAGWIVPIHLEPLVQLIERMLESPDILQHARGAARLAAQDFTWFSYRRQTGQAFSQLLAS